MTKEKKSSYRLFEEEEQIASSKLAEHACKAEMVSVTIALSILIEPIIGIIMLPEFARQVYLMQKYLGLQNKTSENIR